MWRRAICDGDTIRFQKGTCFPYPRAPRGPGRGDLPYRMSRRAYQARLRNLGGVERQRTYGETRRNELEIALATHRRENYRVMAKRLGLRSHAHCWRVAHRYRTRQIPMLPSDEQELLAMRDSLYRDPASVTAHAPAPSPQAPPSPEPYTYVIPERYRDLEKWKEEYYAERPWLPRLRTQG